MKYMKFRDLVSPALKYYTNPLEYNIIVHSIAFLPSTLPKGY